MMEAKTGKEVLDRCIAFLQEIGIETAYHTSGGGSLLPGLTITGGVIYINEETLSNPGDILHEAGHIAVVPAAERHSLDEHTIAKRRDQQAEEMMAIAWSYAACVHLALDPYVVFHDDGYRGGGSYIVDNFREKQFFGLPMLQWIGLAYDANNAAKHDVPPFPHMIKWLRD